MHSEVSQVFEYMTQSFGLSLLLQTLNFCLALCSAQHVGSKSSKAQGAAAEPKVLHQSQSLEPCRPAFPSSSSPTHSFLLSSPLNTSVCLRLLSMSPTEVPHIHDSLAKKAVFKHKLPVCHLMLVG